MKKLLLLLPLLLLASSAQAGLKAVSGGSPNVSNATGTLAVGNGGTGQTTAALAAAALEPVRIIASGTSDSATTADVVIAWNSASGAAKAQTIPGCSSTAYRLTITDEAGSAGTANITITAASGTINKNGTTAVIDQNFGSKTLKCDGVSNYMVM